MFSIFSNFWFCFNFFSFPFLVFILLPFFYLLKHLGYLFTTSLFSQCKPSCSTVFLLVLFDYITWVFVSLPFILKYMKMKILQLLEKICTLRVITPIDSYICHQYWAAKVKIAEEWEHSNASWGLKYVFGTCLYNSTLFRKRSLKNYTTGWK